MIFLILLVSFLALLFLFLLLGSLHSIGQALQLLANQFSLNSMITYADEDVIAALEKWRDLQEGIERFAAGRRY